MKSDVRQLELEVDPGALDDLVPAVKAALAIRGIIVAQTHVDGGERRLIDALDLPVHELEHRVSRALETMVVLDLGFLETALEPGIVGVRSVGRDLRAEQV